MSPFKNRNDKKDWERVWKRNRSEERRTRGVCIRCGSEPHYTNLTTCYSCTLKQLASRHLGSASRWLELEAILVQQSRRCAYSGRPIDIGSSGSIEHVRPTSRHLRSKTDIANIRWVDKDINVMKGAMEVHEFLERCRQVLVFFGYSVSKDDTR